MKWNNKEIADLTNDELLEAKAKLQEMETFATDKKSNPKFAKKFKNQPEPNVNPNFTELKQLVTSEVEKRGI